MDKIEKNIIDLSVVVPIYNEAPIIPELIDRLHASVSPLGLNVEYILVDDGSQDTSLAQLKFFAQKNAALRYISLSRNFGHQIAIMAGLEHCQGKAVVIIDGDLQDPPELIPKLYEQYQQGFKVVYTKRIHRKGESLFKKVTAKLYYRFLRTITRVNIPTDSGDYRLIDRQVVSALLLMPEKHKYLRGQIAWIGFKQTFVPFERDIRKIGKTNFTVRKMVRFAWDGVTGFSDLPLKLATVFGFWVSLISLFIIIYALLSYFLWQKAVPGWTSQIISSTFIGGIQLLTIGIIGEYIGRINSQVRNRPLYIISDTNFEQDLEKKEI